MVLPLLVGAALAGYAASRATAAPGRALFVPEGTEAPDLRPYEASPDAPEDESTDDDASCVSRWRG